MKNKKRVKYIILILFAVIQIFPLLWLINFSLKGNNEIYTESSLKLPEIPKFSNYVEAWITGNVAEYFINSVIVTFTSVLITIVISCMMAYGITRMKWKGSNLVLSFLMLGMMIPIHATLIPLFLLMQKVGFLNTYWCIIIPYIATGLPLAVFIISNFLRSVPYELEEAAYMDGCGVIRCFLLIITPVLKPAVATVAIFTFMSDWNEFIMASTYLQSSELYTLPIGLTAFRGSYTTAMGPMAAAIIITCIPLILFYCICSEQVEKSFTAGAVLK